MIARLLLTALAVIGASVSPVHAQVRPDRPVIFLHGFKASGNDWSAAAARLKEQIVMAPKTPTLTWRNKYADQANQLENRDDIESLPRTPAAVGHSNGGIVAREWSKLRDLRGIVTIGTPHRGVPLIKNFTHWWNFNSDSRFLVAMVMSAFSGYSEWNWVLDVVFSHLELFDALSFDIAVHMAVMLGLDAGMPVAAQMHPGSSYLNGLNSNSNLAREVSGATVRVGIASIARRFFWAGPARGLWPDRADDVEFVMYLASDVLFYYGNFLLLRADPTSPSDMNRAFALLDLSDQIDSVDPFYCAVVTSTALNSCVENDGVVPVTSQSYPGATNLVIHGPAHTQERSMADAVLYDALVNHMGIPARVATPPPPPPPPDDDEPQRPPSNASYVLFENEIMDANDILHSEDGRYHLMYQGDGNLVLFDRNWNPLWHSGTHGSSPGMAIMQGDGNFVVYDAGGTPLWESGTAGNHGAYLVVQNDGNVVILDSDNEAIWHTGTGQ